MIKATKESDNVIQIKLNRTYLYNPQDVDKAKEWAVKTDGVVLGEDYSSKAYAVGGEGTETSNAKYYNEKAEEQATLSQNSAILSQESSSEAVISAELSKNWAIANDGVLPDNERSSKNNSAVSYLYAEAPFNQAIEDFDTDKIVVLHGGGSGGTSDYDDLSNKPSINGVELNGNLSTSQIGIVIPDVSGFVTTAQLNTKQDLLVSASNIKTINGVSVLGSGNIEISSSDVSKAYVDQQDTLLSNRIDTKANTSSLSTVATSGSYNDLSDTPTIPSISGLATETYVDSAVAPKENSLIESFISSAASYVLAAGYYYNITSPISSMTITSATGQGAIEFATTAEFDIVVGEGLLIDGADKLTCKAGKIYTLIYNRGILFISGGA